MSDPTDGTTQALVDILAQGIQDANATRYISAVGLVLLLYDHLLTFQNEVELVWKANPSFAKKLFLLNRYMVAGSQITTAYYLNRYDDSGVTDRACKNLISFVFVYGIFSVGCGNVLVLLRVVSLWDRDRRIVKLMGVGFLISFLSSVAFMIGTLVKSYPGYSYAPAVHSCVSVIKVPIFPAVWAASLVFEVLVFVSVLWNALNRPRLLNTPLRRVLLRDGIIFFGALAILRSSNLIIAVVARPSLIMVGVFFVWAMTTLVLNRSLLNIQKASRSSSLDLDTSPRAMHGKTITSIRYSWESIAMSVVPSSSPAPAPTPTPKPARKSIPTPRPSTRAHVKQGGTTTNAPTSMRRPGTADSLPPRGAFIVERVVEEECDSDETAVAHPVGGDVARGYPGVGSVC